MLDKLIQKVKNHIEYSKKVYEAYKQQRDLRELREKVEKSYQEVVKKHPQVKDMIKQKQEELKNNKELPILPVLPLDFSKLSPTFNTLTPHR